MFASVARLARRDKSRSIHSQLGICVPRHHEGLRSAMVQDNVPGRFIAPMSSNGLRLKAEPLRPASGLCAVESKLRAATGRRDGNRPETSPTAVRRPISSPRTGRDEVKSQHISHPCSIYAGKPPTCNGIHHLACDTSSAIRPREWMSPKLADGPAQETAYATAPSRAGGIRVYQA